ANIGRAAVIPAIKASSNGKLIAVASRDAEKASKFANDNQIPQSYGSYEALLADDQIDAIYIPLPNSMHHQWVIAAANAGKHVLCEKPLALNEKECIEMDSAAQVNHTKLMEAFMYRFHPQTGKVIQLIRDNAIGELKSIHSVFTFHVKNKNNIRYDSELGGGSLMDVGCYCVNIIRTLAEKEPVEVQAAVNWADTGVDKSITGIIKFESGLIASFSSSLAIERNEFYYAAGSGGVIKVEHSFLPGKDDTQILLSGPKSGETSFSFSGVDQYQLMVEHFADCIIDDLPLRYPALEAAKNMKVIDALYNSARNHGERIKL
ncbi:MAG TPA: Gfo/Idh/MocA family oxidoreductase, partial [Anaerovoracaceae bacterium]|nr:Gfo/Idh/MocA family oxidoreductase [Anaerovoracaceae bacterium]